MPLLLFLMGACADKSHTDDSGRGPDCPNLTYSTCEDVGLPSEDFAAFCDECGDLWVCHVHDNNERVALVGIPCECINGKGYVEYVKDTECDPTGMTAD